MKRIFPWVLFIFTYLGLRFYYLDLVPIWDGKGYYDHLEHAVYSTGPFFVKYSLFGHSTVAWALLCSIPIRIFHGNIIAFNAFLLVFDCITLFAFYRLINFFAAKSVNETEKVLIISCFAFNPIILATQLNFSLDTGLLGFFVIYLYLWVGRKFILAAMVGCLMSLTKELGLVLCLIFPILGFIFDHFKKETKSNEKSPPYWLLIGLPLASFASYVYLKSLVKNTQLFWDNNPLNTKETIELYLNPFASQTHVINTQQDFLILVFISNFSWVILVVLATLLGIRLWRRFHPTLGIIGIKNFHLWAAFILISYFLTRFPTYLNARYVSPIIAMLIFLLWTEVMKVLHSSRTRIILLAVVLIFQVDAVFYSDDPLTAIYFGRYPLGNGQYYGLSSRDSMHSFVRDQLVYNTQFAQLDRAIDTALAFIKPSSKTVICAHESMLWEDRTLGPLNPLNYQRVAYWDDALIPKYRSVDQVRSAINSGKLKGPVWYIVFPFIDWAPDLRVLCPLFQRQTIIHLMDNNYPLVLYKFEGPKLSGPAKLK